MMQLHTFVTVLVLCGVAIFGVDRYLTGGHRREGE